MKAAAVGGADVHSRPEPDVFKALQDFYFIFIVYSLFIQTRYLHNVFYRFLTKLDLFKSVREEMGEKYTFLSEMIMDFLSAESSLTIKPSSRATCKKSEVSFDMTEYLSSIIMTSFVSTTSSLPMWMNNCLPPFST
jgi:hypothetical protein